MSGSSFPARQWRAPLGSRSRAGPRISTRSKKTWRLPDTKASSSSCSPLRQFRRSSPQVATDVLQRIGMNIDLQVMEWGSVVARRASREPIDKGGWNIFYTYLGGMGNISPGPDIAIRASGADSWFGWPVDPKMEELRAAWFDAPDLAVQQRICREMQQEFWQSPSYVPLGM